MPFFQCRINGTGFPGRLIDEQGTVGFYTTRWVEAVDPQEAVEEVLEAIRREPAFQLGDGPPSDARIFVESIDQVRRLPHMLGRGATWNVEES
jgi:nitrogen regulatory protein PII